ncbi:MAG: hypothetical protein ACRDJ4_01720 [Actinomycetota bacterium]
MIIYERGEDLSHCLDCAFVWRQMAGSITVARSVLRQLAGLKRHTDIKVRPSGGRG